MSRPARDEAWQHARFMRATTFTSATPCKTCGGTLRYTANRICVLCHRRNARESYQRRKDRA